MILFGYGLSYKSVRLPKAFLVAISYPKDGRGAAHQETRHGAACPWGVAESIAARIVHDIVDPLTL